MQFNEEQKALAKTALERMRYCFCEEWERNGSFPAHKLFKNG